MGTTQGMLVELLDLERVEAVLICIPCLEVRQAQPDMLLGLHDPGDLREQWGCRSRAAASGSSVPGVAHSGRASWLDGHL